MKIARFLALLWVSLLAIGLGQPLLGLEPTVLAAATPKAPAPAQANPNAGQALEIGPPVLTLSADPGQTIKAQLNLRDVSSGNLLVKGQVNDFLAAGEDGTPKIITDESEVNPYSIKGWVPALPSFVLVPKQIKTMDITINVPKDASPGGHYGVIRFTATPPELHDTGVSLSASLGSLVLITVSGKTTESLTIKDFTISQKGKVAKVFQSTPLQFVERIQNTGNIHEQPVGQIVITSMFGKKVAAVNVNLPPRNVLPASTRKFEQPLDSSVIGTKKLFGKYTANLTVTYGTNKKTTTTSLSFWVIPYRLIMFIVIGLVALFFILRFGLRSYNRRIIGKAYKTRRR